MSLGLQRLPATKSWRPNPWTLAAGFTLLLGAAISAFWLAQQSEADSQWVRHSIEVREAATLLLGIVHEAETGQRGYLLTGDNRYLQPYNDAVFQVHTALDRIHALAADRPEQHGLLARLQTLATEKLAELDKTLDLAKEGRLDQALAIVNTDRGELLMQEIRTVVSAFIVEESRRLIARQEQAAKTRGWLITTIVAAIAATAILALLSATITRRNLAALNASRAELKSLNERLEERVQQRTQELEVAREQAEREAKRAEHERNRVELLLQEATHRVGNNLAMVSSLLGLHSKRMRNSEAQLALEAARSRVQAISNAERRLRLGDDLQSTRVDELLESVVSDALESVTQDRRLAVERSFQPIVIPSRDSTTLAVALSELIRNAAKHGFPEGRSGTIRVAFEIDGQGVPSLVVADDGIGFDDGTEDAQTGLGTTIIDGFARQYGGQTIRETNEGGGTVVRVTLPELTVYRSMDSSPQQERSIAQGGSHAN